MTAGQHQPAKPTATVRRGAKSTATIRRRAKSSATDPRREALWWEASLFAAVAATGIGLAGAKLGDPLGVDEAWTAGQYVLESLWTAFAKYDEPNNHVLHTLLAWGAHRTVGPSVVALRLPAFLSWCLLLPAVWWFVRQEAGWLAAAFATTFTATSRYLLEYGSSARGYTQLLLLFVLVLLAGRSLVRAPRDHKRWALWALVVALGIFTIPVMAFPAAIVVAWMLLARRRQRGIRETVSFAIRTAAWSAAAAAVGLALYLPAMASQGAGAFFSNEFVETVPQAPMLYLQRHLWPRWHLSIPTWGQAVLLVLAVVGAVAARASPGEEDSARPARPGGRWLAGRHWLAGWRRRLKSPAQSVRLGGPARPVRPGGRFLLAVVAGSAAVLLVWPVVLSARAGIWLLLSLLIVAGTGAAAVVDNVLGGVGERAGRAVRSAVVLLFLGVFAWLSTAPLPRGVFAQWDPMRFPETAAMVEAMAEDVQPGDCIAAPMNADIGFSYINALAVRTYFKAAGVDVSKNYEALAARKTRTPAYFKAAARHDRLRRPTSCSPFAATSLDWVTSPVSDAQPAAPSPVSDVQPAAPSLVGASRHRLFVLDAGFRRRERNRVGDREVHVWLAENRLGFEVAADFSGGRVYRLDDWTP